MNKRILVTGSNGYIAGQIMKTLSNQGFDFIGLVRENSQIKNNEYLVDVIYSNEDFSQLSNMLTAANIDGIWHLAATYDTNPSHETANKLFFDNILLTSRLLSISSLLKIPFVGASTFSMYDENHMFFPRSFYDTTKFAMSKLAETYDTEAFILHFPDTYGPNDKRKKVPNLIMKGLDSLNSSSHQKINLIHTADIAEAFRISQNLSNGQPKVLDYDLFLPENEIDLKKLAELLGKNVTFLNKVDVYGIPYYKDILTGFSIKHRIEDIKSVLEGE